MPSTRRIINAAREVVTDDVTMLAVPAFLVTIGIEYAALRNKRPALRLPEEADQDPSISNVELPTGYEIRDTLASLAMGSGMLAIGVVAAKAIGPLDRWVYSRRKADLGAGRLGMAGAILAWDFLYYWDHRLGHTVRLFWAAHVNHHSSERYNLSTALRQSWSGSMMHWVFLPMVAMGFTPRQVARAGEINLLYQYWVHTETIDKLPAPIEAVMNTASHHRVHHGSNPQYLDRNYAGIFIIWDKLFASFEPEGERVRYGLTKNISTFNPVKVAFHEWADIVRDVRRDRSWGDRLRHLFGRPGWTPTTP